MKKSPPDSAERHARIGPFWDVMQGRAPMPEAAATLGFQLLDVDPDEGTIKVAFDASTGFRNPAGHIQGGFLAAMLDDTLGPALVATLSPEQFAPTLDLHVQFVRPAAPGQILGRGCVVNKGRAIAFLAGELTDADGALLACATATASIRTMT